MSTEPTMDESGAGPEGTDFDPFDPAFVADPFPTYAELRGRCPVARGGRWGGFWALTTYDGVVAASTDARTFSSADSIVVPRNPVAGRRAPLHYDPPEHTAYRRALNPPFREEAVARMAPTIRAVAADLLEPLLAAGRGDLCAEFASPLTSIVLARWLGVGDDDAREINRSSERFERAQIDGDAATAEAESQLLYDHARRLVTARRADPRDPATDLVSGLLSTPVNGAVPSDEAVAGTVRILWIAGHVAPTAALASAIRHLAGDTALQDRLRADRALVPAAAEELLRLYTPNQGFARTATRDVDLGGRHVRRGEQVALTLTAANRDPAVFTSPDEVNLDRSPNKHLAFGHGVHKCPGAPLARLELTIALTELLTRTRAFTPDGPVSWLRWPIYGPAALPLHLTPAEHL